MYVCVHVCVVDQGVFLLISASNSNILWRSSFHALPPSEWFSARLKAVRNSKLPVEGRTVHMGERLFNHSQ